ncbi:MAG: hypothetical protein AMXMBFR61_26510 [Fimbriimonadales bacterium]
MTEEGVVLLTEKGYKRLSDELAQLTSVRRPEIAERIRASKEQGEFADDNSEFEEAKREQAIVESRIAELKELLSSAQKLSARNIPTDRVGIGSVVVLRNLKKRKEQIEVRVVTVFEADPDEGSISSDSPWGQALLGRAVGDKVVINAPAGELHFEILEIRKK